MSSPRECDSSRMETLNDSSDLKHRPKDGAHRKRVYDARQRALGRKPVQIWMDPGEESYVRRMLAQRRKGITQD